MITLLITGAFVFTSGGSLALAQLGGHVSPSGGDTSCGIVWDAPILLSDTSVNAHSPQIALSGDDTVHVTWEGAPERLPYSRSTDGGMSFIRTDILTDTTTIPFTVWNRLTAHGQRVLMFFKSPGTGGRPIFVKSSRTGGTTWEPLRQVVDSVGEVWSPAIVDDVVSLVYNPFNQFKKILRSTDGGQTWTRTNEDLNYFARVALSAGGVLHLVQHGGSGSGIEVEYRRSTDLGDTWVQRNIISVIDPFWSDVPTVGAGNDSSVVAAWRDAKYGCFGILGCSIIIRRGVSLSDSTSWQAERTVTDVPRGSQPSVAVTDSRMAITWADEIVPNTTFHAAVRVTSYRDTALCPVNDITPATSYEVIGPQIALANNFVHVVWEQAVAPSPSTFRIFYRRGRFVTTEVNERHPRMPTGVMLSQNYPNPFNPSTNIEYRIPKSDLVSLKVYDMLGREVATLVNENKGPGEHTVEWHAENLPSGMYVYRLFAGGRVEARKAILLK